MKTQIVFPLFILSSVCLSSFEEEVFASKHASIATVVSNGSVRAEIKGDGGHTGECITMSLTNNSLDTSYVLLESGRKLDSRNNNEQDMLVIHEMRFVLLPHGHTSAKVYSFCCQSGNGSPRQGSGFSIGPMASTQLVKLANFLSKNIYDDQTAQDAVWAVADRKPFYNSWSNDKRMNELSNFVASTTGLASVNIFDKRSISPPPTIISSTPQTPGKYFETTFRYDLRKEAMVSIVILDAKGNTVRTLLKPTLRQAATYDLEMKLDVEVWSKGKYSVVVYSDYEKCFEKSFEL